MDTLYFSSSTKKTQAKIFFFLIKNRNHSTRKFFTVMDISLQKAIFGYDRQRHSQNSPKLTFPWVRILISKNLILMFNGV
jgi:hypothetical protein